MVVVVMTGILWPLFQFGNTRLGFLKQSSSDSANGHLPGCYRLWTFPLNIGWDMLPSDSFMSRLDSLLGYSTREIQPLQLIVCVVFVGPLFGNIVWNDSGFENLTLWRTTFSLFSIVFYIDLNVLQYDNTLFSFTFVFPSQIVPHFLHSTLAFSFDIDVVLMFFYQLEVVHN